ncbi:MAG: ribonuclease PH [Myxococcota bacterium]
MPTRKDGRGSLQLRPVEIELGIQRNPEGSVLYRSGGTTVLVSVSVSAGRPDWVVDEGAGWLTAEYAMHPRSGSKRRMRDSRNGRIDGRAQEIQRLIGRCLRAALRLELLGDRTLHVDCDVLDADGGTRTASITGGFVALALALDDLRRRGLVPRGVLRGPIAAVSVGLVEGQPMVDLCYEEDRNAQVDLNLVATAEGEVVEVQGATEGPPVPRLQFDALLEAGSQVIAQLVQKQCAALAAARIELERLLA